MHQRPQKKKIHCGDYVDAAGRSSARGSTIIIQLEKMPIFKLLHENFSQTFKQYGRVY